MLGKLILQKDKNIMKSTDIRRLIKRRLQMWKDDLLEELIQEAELCDKKNVQISHNNVRRKSNKPFLWDDFTRINQASSALHKLVVFFVLMMMLEKKNQFEKCWSRNILNKENHILKHLSSVKICLC